LESAGNYFFLALRSGQFRGQKGRGPLEKSRELSHYEFFPRRENNISHFPNQWYIGNFMSQKKKREREREGGREREREQEQEREREQEQEREREQEREQELEREQD
jgi:hypothetical protein